MRVKSILRAAVPAALVVVAAILSSCEVRGAQAAQSPLLRFFERRVGFILYIAPDGNVRIIDQKGGSSRALTTDAGTDKGGVVAYTSPAWSPDGKLVAFTRMTLDASHVVTDASLFTAARDGRKLTRVLSGSRLRPFYLYWSPDSRSVSLLSSVEGESFLEMGMAPAGVEGAYRTLDQGSPFYWDWRADSRSIVVHVNTGQPGADGERMSLLSLEPQLNRSEMGVDPGVFQAPSFSPDGKSIAYASTSQAVSTLHLRALDGSGERTVATDTGGAFLEFSRDGKRIAYLAAQRVQPVPLGTLTIVDLGARPKKLTLKEAPVLEFFWAPDGRTLAFVVPDTAENVDPLFLRNDGVAYVRLMGYEVTSGRTWVIARFPPSRGFFSVLPFFDQYQRSSTMWSPDSKFVSFTALTAEGDAGLFVVSADGNVKPRFLTLGDDAFWSWK
jgi:Tol biopolymer transport system component